MRTLPQIVLRSVIFLGGLFSCLIMATPSVFGQPPPPPPNLTANYQAQKLAGGPPDDYQIKGTATVLSPANTTWYVTLHIETKDGQGMWVNLHTHFQQSGGGGSSASVDPGVWGHYAKANTLPADFRIKAVGHYIDDTTKVKSDYPDSTKEFKLP